MCNCNCRFNCTLFAIISAAVLGVVAAFLQFSGVITVTTAFLWVALGIGVVYLAGLLTASVWRRGANPILSVSGAVCAAIRHSGNDPAGAGAAGGRYHGYQRAERRIGGAAGILPVADLCHICLLCPLRRRLRLTKERGGQSPSLLTLAQICCIIHLSSEDSTP